MFDKLKLYIFGKAIIPDYFCDPNYYTLELFFIRDNELHVGCCAAKTVEKFLQLDIPNILLNEKNLIVYHKNNRLYMLKANSIIRDKTVLHQLDNIVLNIENNNYDSPYIIIMDEGYITNTDVVKLDMGVKRC